MRKVLACGEMKLTEKAMVADEPPAEVAFPLVSQREKRQNKRLKRRAKRKQRKLRDEMLHFVSGLSSASTSVPSTAPSDTMSDAGSEATLTSSATAAPTDATVAPSLDKASSHAQQRLERHEAGARSDLSEEEFDGEAPESGPRRRVKTQAQVLQTKIDRKHRKDRRTPSRRARDSRRAALMSGTPCHYGKALPLEETIALQQKQAAARQLGVGDHPRRLTDDGARRDVPPGAQAARVLARARVRAAARRRRPARTTA